MSSFHELSRARLATLADALDAGRLQPPFTSASLQRYALGADASAVLSELQNLHLAGWQPQQVAHVLRAIIAEREAVQSAFDRIELVWTGPERPGSTSRDTGVVVRELFAGARQSVYVAGFAVFNGRSVFEALAKNMTSNPNLTVKMFLNIARPYGDSRPSDELVQGFIKSFIANEWPGGTLPELYHDPRSLVLEADRRASLHAKCIVVDNRWSFITSANFTEAAQQRNVEAGILVDDVHFALALRQHLDALATTYARSVCDVP